MLLTTVTIEADGDIRIGWHMSWEFIENLRSPSLGQHLDGQQNFWGPNSKGSMVSVFGSRCKSVSADAELSTSSRYNLIPDPQLKFVDITLSAQAWCSGRRRYHYSSYWVLSTSGLVDGSQQFCISHPVLHKLYIYIYKSKQLACWNLQYLRWMLKVFGSGSLCIVYEMYWIASLCSENGLDFQ